MIRTIVSVLLGALGGYVWHRTVGCATGSCPITANPYTSMLYGALLGFLLGLGRP